MKTILPLLSAIAVLASARAQDTQPPMLDSISLSPASIDVTGGAQVLTATLVCTDDDSGFAYGTLFLYNAAGGYVRSIFFNSDERSTGDELSGTYEVPVTIPEYAAAGTWRLGVALWDAEFNRREYGPDDEAFPSPGDELITVANTGTTDTTGPQLVSTAITPGSIDTGMLGQEVTITVNATDDLSGVAAVSISFFNPATDQQFGLFGFANVPTSGDPLNGTFEIPVTIPQGSLDGTWTISVSLRDAVGNRTFNFSPPGGTFEVSNSGGGLQGDLSDATDATQFDWSTSGDADWFIQNDTTLDGIDAAQSGAISDDGSSAMEVTVNGPGTLSFWWKVDSEFEADILSVEVQSTGESHEISGDVDWTEVTLTIPAGPQTIVWTYNKDSSFSVGADAGWVDMVRFLADFDMDLPVLQYINISPSPVDISTGDVEVTVTVVVTDDYNGVDSVYVELFGPYGDSYNGDILYLVGGDAYFGVYETTFTIYQEDVFYVSFYEPGTWRAEVQIDEAVSFAGIAYGPGGNSFPSPGAELFTVADGVSGPDTSGPLLTGINSITPDPVDVTTGSQSVTVNFDLSDNSSGFHYGSIQLYNSGGKFVVSTFFDVSDEIFSTGPLSGTYEVSIPIPAYGPPGQWELAFSLYDYADNVRDYPFTTSFPNPGDEFFEVTNTGPADTTDPVLNGITITPGSVDTSGSPQMIDIELDVSDDLSGIRWAFLYVYDPNGDSVSSLITSIPGGATTTGPLMKSIEIPMGSMEGTWKIAVFLRDMTGNWVRYGTGGSLSMPNPGDEEFTVGPAGASTYDTFAMAYGLTGPDAAPGANADKDPFINILELLLGLDPTTPNPANPAIYGFSQSATAIHLDFTIDPSLTVQVNGDHLEVSDGVGTPFLVTGQTGSNLVDDWVNQLPSPTGGSSYRVSLPFSSGDKGSIRLDFSVP